MERYDGLSLREVSEGEGSGDGGQSGRPDPEVKERPARRRFTVEYKLRIVRAAEACRESGEIGALLRREGLYSSHLSVWRRQYEKGALGGLKPKKRGPKASPNKELLKRIAQLEKDKVRLEQRLEKARVIVEFQKKACELLGIPLRRPGSDEDD